MSFSDAAKLILAAREGHQHHQNMVSSGYFGVANSWRDDGGPSPSLGGGGRGRHQSTFRRAHTDGGGRTGGGLHSRGEGEAGVGGEGGGGGGGGGGEGGEGLSAGSMATFEGSLGRLQRRIEVGDLVHSLVGWSVHLVHSSIHWSVHLVHSSIRWFIHRTVTSALKNSTVSYQSKVNETRERIWTRCNCAAPGAP